MNESGKKKISQDEFLRAKKIESLKGKFVKGIKVICVLIILTALFMIISKSMDYIKRINIFTIDNLNIKGNKYLSFNDIVNIVDLKEGDNIFNINLKELKKKLEFHPRIKSTYIQRELPDKIIINIMERKPVVLLNSKKETSHWLYEADKDGYIIGEYPNIYNYSLPVMTGDKFKNVILGGKINDITVLNILKTLSGMEEKYYKFTRIFAEINVSTEFKKPDITVYLNHFNTKVVFGEKFTRDKLIKLNSLLMVIGNKISRLEYIDFKYDEAIGKYNG